MDKDISSRKSGDDDDVDVDHYFLPRGILDAPSQREEEDMIGGSLLDEIGGFGNVEVGRLQKKSSPISITTTSLFSLTAHLLLIIVISSVN